MWKEENRGHYNAIKARQRAQKLNATPRWLTKCQQQEIINVYRAAQTLEQADGVKRHVDHIIPLLGLNICGLHVPWNLQILPAKDNWKKGNRY